MFDLRFQWLNICHRLVVFRLQKPRDRIQDEQMLRNEISIHKVKLAVFVAASSQGQPSGKT
jgi:hypothetical protein